MGQQVEHTDFSQESKSIFQQRLFTQLDKLETMMSQPYFGDEPLMLGAELEMYLINQHGDASLSNRQLLDSLQDEQFQHELNQYNLELNLSPVAQSGSPFSTLLAEMNRKLQKLDSVAKAHHCSALPIGILPSLKHEQLTSACMTGITRYACLADNIYQQRGEDFQVHISGDEELKVDFSDICAEGANTSFQVHLMAPPEKLTQLFNAAQLTLPLVTAIGANSPIFLGKNLWHETRIALFKQSIDMRLKEQYQWQQPTRVNFGHGWLRHSIWELFAESVALYPPLIPYLKPENSTSDFHELSFHMGTIWPWHRPVLSSKGNGHIRLEFRAIPAGPTPIDMLANAAFAIGLATGVSDQIDKLITVIPFRFAEYNFYRAAQYGLDAKILWPIDNHYQPQEVDIKKVIEKLLPVAHQGLISLGISSAETNYYLSIIEQRLSEQMTGAIWQKQMFSKLSNTMPTSQACQTLVKRYQANYQSALPVACWE